MLAARRDRASGGLENGTGDGEVILDGCVTGDEALDELAVEADSGRAVELGDFGRHRARSERLEPPSDLADQDPVVGGLGEGAPEAILERVEGRERGRIAGDVLDERGEVDELLFLRAASSDFDDGEALQVLLLDDVEGVSRRERRGPGAIEERDDARIRSVARIVDERRAALLDPNEPDLGEAMHRLTNEDPRDAKPLDQDALGRHRRARRELAVEDRAGEPFEHVVGHVRPASGLQVVERHPNIVTWLPSWRKGDFLLVDEAASVGPWRRPGAAELRSALVKPIDLRSDTVTRPTRAMRQVMADADVGDDVYGEDPTVNRLEARAAEILGKEAALFVPSGTMANQIALQLLTQRSDEVLVGAGSHLETDESGAAAAWAGVQFRVVGTRGIYDLADFDAAWQPYDYHCPRTSVLAVENTHNRGGGRVFPQNDLLAVTGRARSRGLKLHLDGARLWNAAIASERSEAEISAPFDTVNVCYSKGLGAPIGSALASTKEAIEAARRFRKMFGGGMRQVGVIAAAALYALDHQRARLADDHDRARSLGDALRGVSAGATVLAVETNQVAIDTPNAAADDLVAACAETRRPRRRDGPAPDARGAPPRRRGR